jgi:hypothetical protein
VSYKAGGSIICAATGRELNYASGPAREEAVGSSRRLHAINSEIASVRRELYRQESGGADPGTENSIAPSASPSVITI